jgi:hypothetical protein
VRGQLGAEPLAQQPGAHPLDRVVGEGRVGREHAVQLGQRRAHQLRVGGQALRPRVGQPVVPGPGAQ